MLSLAEVGDNAAMEAEPIKAEPSKRRRRRFQFRLRTLMIGVTLLALPCAYVGWQAKIVRERKAYLRANAHSWPVGTFATVQFAQGDKSRAPTAIRAWLGDWAQFEVWVDVRLSKAEKQSVAALFPEANICEWPPHEWRDTPSESSARFSNTATQP